MLDRRFSGFAIAVVFLSGSRAIAADVVTIRCDYPGYFQEIIADQRGISVTQYRTNKDTGQLKYVKNYTENKKEGNDEFILQNK